MIQTILFDFDGTLFDTGEGILRSVQYALEGFGIHETDTARLRKFVGPPLLDSFSELYAMTPEQAQAAVARYRERYLPVGIYECTLYPGIPELLERLRAHGFRVAVATGKPTPMACSILQRFDLERLFDCVIGCEYDGSRSTKAEVVAAVLAETHTPPEAALMVGDRKYDVTGAAACGEHRAASDGDGAVGIEGLVVGIAAAPYGHIAAGDIDGEIIVCKIGICCVQAIVRADNADIA